MSSTNPETLDLTPPTLEEIRGARRRLGDHVRTTPVWQWQEGTPASVLGEDTRVFLKLELWQYAGTFKPRGALLNMLALEPAALARGVTAVSAGNHAMAVGYAANILGTSAKVVMPRNANPARVAGSRAYGAEVVLVDDVHRAFEEVRRIEREEGRAFIHPFEGRQTVEGTATVGLELMEAQPDLEAVIVPIGGGGLGAGVAAAVKQLSPQCQVFGVEPSGADTMHRSFASGHPENLDRVRTIADSLGAPHAAPYTFSLCQRYLDGLVMVEDDHLRRAMALLFQEVKLALEPAAAAATAALLGPLADRLRGKRVGLIVCGSNIDPETFHRQLQPA
ncbi:MAG: pyridoxal-phosphate dependent enzyme [Deltaproteobacteria bacterium]|nr:pyridoxal-phosphate dependent enzyme [Deltaproteobacteria bacterium]